ncbi:MAG: glycoside hydrolase family 3 N-terminal domain-containing protein [Saprospiraceae bacterium]
MAWSRKTRMMTGIFMFLSILVTGQDAAADQWVDAKYNQMSETERIGQLFMIRAHSNLGPDHVRSVEDQIRKYQVGGLCFFQGDAPTQAALTNSYQGMSKIPLLISMDAEWGLGMRFKEKAISFPRQLTLGAIQENWLIYDMGKEIAQEMLRIGVHVNFAPVVDVNNNASNPVINDRSFGEDRYNVATKGYMYMKGMQDAGVLACAKHFPGHGDTDVDSHQDLPVIRHNMQRLDSIELYPFKSLIQHGVGGVMVAHLSVPAIDPRPHYPTSLSHAAITDLLKDQLHFDGLVFTDALDMKGVTKYFKPGEVAVEAFLAGHDMLVLPENMEEAIQAFRAALDEGKITWPMVEARVKRILQVKYRMGLINYQPIDLNNIEDDINNHQALALKQRLYENAITLVRNREDHIPIKDIADLKLATVAIGSNTRTPFQKRIEDYVTSTHFYTDFDLIESKSPEFLKGLEGKDLVIISLVGMSKYKKNQFGISDAALDFIEKVRTSHPVILTVFGNPYSLEYFTKIPNLICAYEDDPVAQDVTAQALFGALPFKGRLPISAGPEFPFSTGVETASLDRLGYAVPERVGMNSDSLRMVDAIVTHLIRQHAAPGCQVLIAKDQKIIYEKAFGKHTYDQGPNVQLSDLYDVASITKVAATTLAIMKLYELGAVRLDETLGEALPELQETNKSDMQIEEVMAHHSGLIGWIPFYRETVIGNRRSAKPDPKFYRNTASRVYSVEVAKDLFMKQSYEDSIWQRIYDSDLRSSKSYRYSDLGFYLMAKVVQRSSQMPLDRFVDSLFYHPLGLRHTAFNPYREFLKKQIVPTEEDHYFRNQMVQGYVQDMGAAMLGGVSGHAGLFTNAEDLASIMQLLLNGGTYGGKQYFHEETIKRFTTRFTGSTRRGIGFDMKELDIHKPANMAKKASYATFGHTGYTGTCVWADPELNLIFVFLSNRTYPNANINLLNRENYRERIHEAIYASIIH